MDTNADQFARLGNPWITERDRHDAGTVPLNRKETRANRRVRPCDRHYPEARPIGREPTPEEAKAKVQRDMLTHVLRLGKARRGGDVLACAGYEPVRPLAVIRPVQERPVSEWAPEKIAGDIHRLAKQTHHARVEAKLKLGDVKAAALLELGAIAL